MKEQDLKIQQIGIITEKNVTNSQSFMIIFPEETSTTRTPFRISERPFYLQVPYNSMKHLKANSSH
jgi:hypothetical protein